MNISHNLSKYTYDGLTNTWKLIKDDAERKKAVSKKNLWVSFFLFLTLEVTHIKTYVTGKRFEFYRSFVDDRQTEHAYCICITFII